jgi:anti-anti-sigma factor
MAHLEIGNVKREDGVVIVYLKGSLDTESYENLQNQVEKLLTYLKKMLILDLKDLEYISSMGISALFTVKRWAQDKSVEFAMVNVPTHIQEVLKIIDALPEVTLFKSVEEADEYFDSVQRRVKEQK